MRATLVAYDSVDFIKNQCARCLQHPAAAIAGQQYIKRFRSGNHDVRWPLSHRSSLGRRGIPCAHEGTNIDLRQTQRKKFLLNSLERNLQVSLNVIAEGF